MDPKGPDDAHVHKVPMTSAPPVRERATLSWPWGLVAIGVLALAWVGVYLIWNGFVFLFN